MKALNTAARNVFLAVATIAIVYFMALSPRAVAQSNQPQRICGTSTATEVDAGRLNQCQPAAQNAISRRLQMETAPQTCTSVRRERCTVGFDMALCPPSSDGGILANRAWTRISVPIENMDDAGTRAAVRVKVTDYLFGSGPFAQAPDFVSTVGDTLQIGDSVTLLSPASTAIRAFADTPLDAGAGVTIEVYQCAP